MALMKKPFPLIVVQHISNVECLACSFRSDLIPPDVLKNLLMLLFKLFISVKAGPNTDLAGSSAIWFAQCN